MFFDFPEFGKKWLELLKEVMPQLARVAVLWDPATGTVQMKAVDSAANLLNVKLEILEVRGAANLNDSILAAGRKGVDAMLMLSSPVFAANADRIAGLTLGLRLPAVSLFPEFARAGGLMAYGVDSVNTSSGCGPGRQGAARRKAGRAALRIADQVRTGDQSQDRQGTRPHRAADRCSPAPTR